MTADTSDPTPRPIPINALQIARREVRELQDLNDRLAALTETYLGLVAGADSVEISGNEVRIHLNASMHRRHLVAFGDAVNAMNAGRPIFIGGGS